MTKVLKQRKFTAWLILLTFLFTSIVPTNIGSWNNTAEAATDGSVAGQIELQPAEQIINGTDGQPEVKIKKSITAGENENEFNITLQVKTPEVLEEIPSSADAAVVLVIDKSGSMDDYVVGCGLEEHSHNSYSCGTDCNHRYNQSHNNDCYTCGKTAHQHSNSCRVLECQLNHNHNSNCYQTRMDATRVAAQTFVQEFSDSAVNAGDKRLISVVEFANNATRDINWQDVATRDGKTAIDNELNEDFDSFDGNGGTNMAGGLQLAANMINAAKTSGGVLENIDNVTVILLTDGCPTYHISGDATSTEYISGTVGGSNRANTADQRGAINAANNVKLVATLKIIALNTGSAEYLVNNNWQSLDTATWLQNNVGSTYRASDVTSLVDSFDQINTMIQLGTTAWRVTDPMAANIVYTGSLAGANANDANKTGDTYVYTGNTITWNLKDSYPDRTETVGSTTWYVYTLEYPVRLDNTASGFNFDTPLATNGDTILDYFMFSKVVETDEITADSMKHAAFNVPQVEGYKGDVTFQKTDAITGNGLAGAEFTLTMNNCHDSHGGAYTATATYAQDGTITFSNVPSGHQYTLAETKAPVGYEESATNSWNVSVAFGQVTIEGANVNNSNEVVIPNTPQTISVKLQKNWNDGYNQDGSRPPEIYAILVATVGNTTYDVVKDASGNDVGNVQGHAGVHKIDGSTAWAKTVNNLPEYADGQKIEYEWFECELQNGSYVKLNNGDGITVTKGNKTFSYVVSGNTEVELGTDGILHSNITNTYTPETVKVAVQKTWDLTGIPDGYVAPGADSVTVHLTKDGIRQDTVYGVKKLSAAADKKTEVLVWENLPRYENGEEIAWSVEEELGAYGNDFVIVQSVQPIETEDGIQYAISLINKYDPTHRSLLVEKIWDDEDNQDGKRPENLEVQLLYKTDTTEWAAITGTGIFAGFNSSVTLNAANQWEYVWSALPQYENPDGNTPETRGQAIHYKVSEVITTEMAKDYTAVVSEVDTVGKASWALELKNKHVPETVKVSVLKTWDDNNNQDGIRPTSATVELYGNGISTYEQAPEDYKNRYRIELSASNNWTHEWTVPKYHDGKEITWRVREMFANDHVAPGGTVENGYIVNYTTDENGVLVITNSYTPEKVNKTVTKVWDDADNQDGIRPASVTVQLMNGTIAVGEAVTLNEGNHWSYEWTELPKFAGTATPIDYTVAEVVVPDGYTNVVTDDGTGNAFTVTNTHTPETVAKTVTKVWDDNDNQDGRRPASVTVQLMNGTIAVGEAVTLNEGNHWSYKWTELPKFAGTTTPINYTVIEGDIPYGYTSIVTDDDENTEDGNAFKVTNSYTTETTTVAGKKVWVDDDNRDGLRPESITVNLLANDVEIDEVTVTPDKDGNWNYSFTGLPVYENGTQVRYAVTEDAVYGYTPAIDGYNITNTHETETADITVTKIWEDYDNQDRQRPAELNITLTGNDGSSYEATMSGSGDTWTYTFKGLPVNFVHKVDGEKYYGEAIEYTVDEEDLSSRGYVKTIEGLTIINSRAAEVTEVSGVKVWNDTGNQDGKRPDSITIHLLANDEFYWPDGSAVGTVQLDNGNDGVWDSEELAFSFKHLPKNLNGSEIAYTIVEEAVAEYSSNIVEEDGFYTITNTYPAEKTELHVEKTWRDNNNQDGIRPESITVELYAKLVDDESEPQVVKTMVLQASDNPDENWRGVFENLDRYNNGKEIVYTVQEQTVEGYTADIHTEFTGIVHIVNTHNSDTTEVSGTKTWIDDNNAEGIRPESIEVHLYIGNSPEDPDKQYVTSTTVTADTNWSYSFTDLPKHDNGQEISYTITEEPVAGYNTEYNGNNITNYIGQKTFDITGTKTWSDDIEHDSVTIQLFRDGNLFNTTTASTTTNWTYEFTDIPVYAVSDAGEKADGHKYNYKLVEESVDGYVASYDLEKQDNGNLVIDITNTYSGPDAEFVTISGTKTWNDNNDAMGKRPESITVNLFRDDVQIDSAIVTADTNWAYAFDNLPKADENGNAYVYTVTEDAVPEYRSVITQTSAGFDIINTLITGDAGQISVSKVVLGEKAPSDGVFGFVLNIEASAPDWSALDVWEKMQLEKAYDAAVEEQVAAEEAWNDAKAEFAENAKLLNTTGSAIRFAMAEESTTPSGYAYLMIDDDGRITSTTSSSYNFEGLALDETDESVIEAIIEVIQKMAEDFNRVNSAFLNALQENITDAAYALGFMKNDAQNLLDTADRLFEADTLVESTSSAVYEFVNSSEVTTASAITLVITDVNGNVTRQAMSNDAGEYEYAFDLKDGETYSFDIETTTGSSIKYSVREVTWVTKDYQGTDITLNGADVDSGVERFTGEYVLNNDDLYGFVFTNIYDDGSGGGGGGENHYLNRTVEKVWDDNNNPNRPASVTVNLLRDGTVYDTVTLSAANSWSYTWLNLDASYIWNVEEINIPEGYTASIEKKEYDTFVITNSCEYVPEEEEPENPPVPDTPDTPDDPDNPVPGEPGIDIPGTAIDEPDPLDGTDAPQTGDATNAIPFVLLMVFSVCGIIVTHRRFNET